MEINSNNKTIAKNTIYLYFRMMFTMLVALYTSRVILQILGASDYGIYQTVGGVVGMLAFLNGALSTGSSRFLTYEMGTGDNDKLKRTFSTVLFAHIILAFIILILAETLGIWFINNKLVIPVERLSAAIVAFHFSVIASMVNITQVPYTACIISHEKMSIYAYMSIAEAILKLSIVYMLTIGTWDKLKLYALLYLIVSLCIAFFYRFYCIRYYEESKFRLNFDRVILKNVLSYSGWNLLANTSLALVNQGGIILINMFFNPVIVTAQSLATQVNMAANQFIQNFRTAANPQIVKKYAAGDFTGSQKLLLASTKYSFFLMLLLALPIILVSDNLLKIWLGNVPPYTSTFLRITAFGSLFTVLDTSFYTALYAKGRIRENALISPSIYALVFPLTYVCYMCGTSPISLSILMVTASGIVGLVVKPILIIKIVGYQLKDIISILKTCGIVTIISSIFPLAFFMIRDRVFHNDIMEMLAIVLICVLSVLSTVWLIGIDKDTKIMIIKFLKNKIKNRK